MKCWNCQAEVADQAKSCPECEADLTDPQPVNAETIEMINDWLSDLPEETKTMLQEYAESCNTAEEFANAILVGPCVHCQSNHVGNCEDDPDYNDITLGRCFDCGTVWCTECDHILEKNEVVCPRAEEHDADLGDMFSDDDEDKPNGFDEAGRN